MKLRQLITRFADAAATWQFQSRAQHPETLGNLDIGTSTDFAQPVAAFRRKFTIEY